MKWCQTIENVRILQFLDLIKDVDVYSEEEGDENLSYYPEKICKNMYETGVLAGVSA